MSQYRSSQPDIGGTGYRGPTAQRWDAERFANEASRYEERDVRISTGPARGSRIPEDDFFDSRAPPIRGGGSRYDDDMVRERDVYREEVNIPIRSRKPSMQMEREREEIHERQYYKSPSPPPVRRGAARPGMLRRQSSLDTFDRKPTFPRYVEREEYGAPALRRDFRRDPIDVVPLPTSRRIGPPGGTRYVEKEYERVEVDGPDRAYYPPQPERVREREIIRTRRRSRSRSSRSSSSSSDSSVDSRSTRTTNKTNKPKRGRTRMPAKLVSKRAIIELGYPFEEEGQVIIIQRALGREHIDEVIQLSEKYKSSEKSSKSQKGSPRESSEKIIEEKRTETFYQTETMQQPPPMMQPMPPPPMMQPMPPPPMMQPMPIPAQPVMAPTPQPMYATPAPEIIEVAPPMMQQPMYQPGPPPGEMVTTQEITRIEETSGDFRGGRHRARSMGPTPHHMEYYETSGPVAMYGGPHAMHQHDSMYHSGAMIRRDIHSAAAEAEALRAERRAQKELRRADRIRYAGDARASDGALAVYEPDVSGGPVVEVRRSRKGKMSLVVPSKYRR